MPTWLHSNHEACMSIESSSLQNSTAAAAEVVQCIPEPKSAAVAAASAGVNEWIRVVDSLLLFLLSVWWRHTLTEWQALLKTIGHTAGFLFRSQIRQYWQYALVQTGKWERGFKNLLKWKFEKKFPLTWCSWCLPPLYRVWKDSTRSFGGQGIWMKGSSNFKFTKIHQTDILRKLLRRTE